MSNFWTELGSAEVRQNGNTFWTEVGAFYEGDEVGNDYDQAIADAVALGDSVSLARFARLSLSDALSLGETVSGSKVSQEGLSDPVALGEVVAARLVSARAALDAIVLGDSTSLRLSAARRLVDPVGLSDTVTLVLTRALPRRPGNTDYAGPKCSTIDGSKLSGPSQKIGMRAASGCEVRQVICGPQFASPVPPPRAVDPVCAAFTRPLPQNPNGGGDMNIPDDSGNGPNPPKFIFGCTDPKANNYNPQATFNDGSCDYSVPPPPGGCTDPTALNFDPEAEVNNGTCLYGNDEMLLRIECENAVPNSVAYLVAENTFVAASKAAANAAASAYWLAELQQELNCTESACYANAGSAQYGWRAMETECVGGEWFTDPYNFDSQYLFQT